MNPAEMVLLDTDVLVEVLRGKPAALAWLAGVNTCEFGIPGIVAMELLCGCRNRNEQNQVRKFAAQFTILWPVEHEFAVAFDLLAEHRLTSGLSIPDCLIAAMALGRRCLGYDISEKYIKVAAQRLKAAAESSQQLTDDDGRASAADAIA